MNYFKLAVDQAREHAAKTLTEAAIARFKDDKDWEGHRLNYEEQVEQAEYRRKARRDECDE